MKICPNCEVGVFEPYLRFEEGYTESGHICDTCEYEEVEDITTEGTFSAESE